MPKEDLTVEDGRIASRERHGNELLGAGRRNDSGPARQRRRQTQSPSPTTASSAPTWRESTCRTSSPGGRATCTICSSTACCYGRVVRPPSRGATLDGTRHRCDAGAARRCHRGARRRLPRRGRRARGGRAASGRAAACRRHLGPDADAARRGRAANVSDPGARRNHDARRWVTVGRQPRTGRRRRPITVHSSRTAPSHRRAPSRSRSTMNCEIWSHSQSVYNLRREIARELGMRPEQLVVRHVEGAGLLRPQRRRRRRHGRSAARTCGTRQTGAGGVVAGR